MPVGGVLPLSFSLDSVGPLAPTVACCAALDAIMADEEPADLEPFPLLIEDGIVKVALPVQRSHAAQEATLTGTKPLASS